MLKPTAHLVTIFSKIGSDPFFHIFNIYHKLLSVSFLCFPVYANSVIPRVGPCPPLPPSPPLRPFGLLRGHCRATLALLWLCLNHYCTPGGGLKTVMLVPPPPANRLYSSYVTIISIPLVIVYLSNSWNKYFYCLLFYCFTVPRVLLWATLFLCTLFSAEMLPVECSVVD